MHRLIWLTLLSTLSGTVMADWVEVSSNSRLTVYADPTSIKETRDTVRMWDLFDHREAKTETSGKKFKSMKDMTEYDCENKISRILYTTCHSEQMGMGEVVYTNKEAADWRMIAPDSPGEKLWKTACKKK
ncbi:MAG: hypothetical protein A2342_00450 [Gallionellales bacterium RIFOXYB12_FULL_54_9]|nr:MAG: hypothetical protein A2342_00450 [Gallionellales bacterium RIFOXYB12_FULL_54_9]